MKKFFEELFFEPKWYHWIVAFLLFPLSMLYGSLMWLRRVLAKPKDYGIPIVSVGNLIVGGSGKTPFVIELANRYEDVAIISRGYGRESSGLVVVSRYGKIECDVKTSGDEAMLMAQSTQATVIVSENRAIAIKQAKEMKAKLIILDDGFNKVDIKKYDILLEPPVIKNYLPFPSGGFREFYFDRVYANLVLKEGVDYHRVVECEDLTQSMMLTTAISNPKRLDKYLPKGVVDRYILEDHAYFDEEVLKEQMKAKNITSLLVTQKDAVKLSDFKLSLSIMKLKLEIRNSVYESIDKYIQGKL
jgi:tetraacyldisaccharide 4'-kinase